MMIHRRCGYFVLACGLLVLGAASVRAADPDKDGKKQYEATIHHKDGKHETVTFDPKEDKHEGQMQKVADAIRGGTLEQLITKQDVSLMTLRWDMGLWTVVVFVLLFLILRKAAWGPMLEGLHKREEGILSALNEAEKARAEAKSLRTHFEAEMAKVGDKVRELMDEARRDAQHVKDEMVTAGKAEINAERDRATKELSMAKDQALKELWEQSATLATLISAKTIKRDLGVDDHRRLLDDALAEMDKSIQNKRGEAWGTKA